MRRGRKKAVKGELDPVFIQHPLELLSNGLCQNQQEDHVRHGIDQGHLGGADQGRRIAGEQEGSVGPQCGPDVHDQ